MMFIRVATGAVLCTMLAGHSAFAQVVADSVADYSGTQGQDGWFYGFYDRTADGDNIYQAGTDFTAMPGGFGMGPHGPAQYWTGADNVSGNWDVFAGNPPWTVHTPTTTHPNDANPGPEHYSVRRWQSDIAGGVAVQGFFNNTSGAGDGTNGRVFHNGVEVFSSLTDGNTKGFSQIVNVNLGDTLDFMVDIGPSPGSNNDGSDGTNLRGSVTRVTPPSYQALVVADSVADFSGTQGQDGWSYGFYNRTGDGNNIYDAATDFTAFPGGSGMGPFSATQAWTNPGDDTNGKWDIFGGNPPWTEITANSTHPSDDNPGPEHYSVRRWESDIDGLVTLAGFFNNVSDGGDGTTGRIYHNGVEIFSALTDNASADFVIPLMVAQGDTLDFLVDIGSADDGSDGTNFGVQIAVAIPEPASLLIWGLLGLGLVSVPMFRRFRRNA